MCKARRARGGPPAAEKLRAVLAMLVRDRLRDDTPYRFAVDVAGTRPWGEKGQGFRTRRGAEEAVVARALELYGEQRGSAPGVDA